MSTLSLARDERECLRFLDQKMEATGAAIGEAIAAGRAISSRGYAMIGNGVARRLMIGAHATIYLNDLRAWRITAKGRALLNEPAAEG